jgi:hypothetical protein
MNNDNDNKSKHANAGTSDCKKQNYSRINTSVKSIKILQ